MYPLEYSGMLNTLTQNGPLYLAVDLTGSLLNTLEMYTTTVSILL